jgi:hypothetical protein
MIDTADLACLTRSILSPTPRSPRSSPSPHFSAELTTEGCGSSTVHQLSSGQISRRGDTLSVQLIRPRIDRREVVLLVWPPNPTPVSPAKLSETVAASCRLLSNAVIDLAARRHRQHQDASGKDEEV